MRARLHPQKQLVSWQRLDLIPLLLVVLPGDLELLTHLLLPSEVAAVAAAGFVGVAAAVAVAY